MQTLVARTIMHASRSAVVKLDSVTVCGQPGQRMVITGFADATHKNVEALTFRQGDAIYGLNYFFTSSAPNSEDEALLVTLCPR